MARADGLGSPFCFQEATSTRASIRLAEGQTGHALVLGHRTEHCKRVAWLDAKMQDPAFRSTAGSRVIQALQQAEYTLRAERLAAAEQTRVEFFTLAREAGA
jgi:alpha-D-ribose 1-methylphosphonate 5-triphosphate synthase subunit PhnG